MHILVVNDDGPPSPQSSPYVHSLIRALQDAGHKVSVCLPHTQRSWIGKAHMIGQTVKPLYYRPPARPAPPAGLRDEDEDQGTTHGRPATHAGVEEWILVDGTPASCVQIGLYHFFADRGPVDLVLSGPNYGRNTTAVFALSSGTLGGALEAAACRRRAVALSYAFLSRVHDPAVVAAASRQSVRVVEALAARWPADGSVDLYSVNVPLVEGVETAKVLYTGMLQNYWGEGSCFTEVEGSVGDEGEEEERIRADEGGQAAGGSGKPAPAEGASVEGLHSHKHFKWSPRFTDVYKSVDDAPPGNDGWAVKVGITSITPLKANFWHSATELHGQELQLDGDVQQALPTASLKTRELPILGQPQHQLRALIAYEDDYVQPLIVSALKKLLPETSFELLKPLQPDASGASVSLAKYLNNPNDDRILQITPYETIDFEFAASHPATSLINSYIIRKALIRKHFLSATVDNWVAKNPDSVLKTHVKRSEAFEVDYAEFLDDALVEAFDLRASLEANAELPDQAGGEGDGGHTQADAAAERSSTLTARDREWWILKPSMSDRGQGIRLFSTMEELQSIFDEWEAAEPDSEEEDEDEESGEREEDDGDADGDRDATQKRDNGEGWTPTEEGSAAAGAGEAHGDSPDYITTSHLRHFVAQPYIDPPLLLPECGDRKFHIRVYVLAVGSLKVYVYRNMLALFAAKAYSSPWASSTTTSTTRAPEDDGAGSAGRIDLDAHLTNTCLQSELSESAKEGSVRRFQDLPLSREQKEDITAQICAVTGELFEAAARGMMVHFQPLGNAFEVFGLDFLVDAAGTAWLLEVNAFPDFKQTGTDPSLRDVVAEFWAGVLRLAVGPFAGASSWPSVAGAGENIIDMGGDMTLVREVDLGRRWGTSGEA